MNARRLLLNFLVVTCIFVASSNAYNEYLQNRRSISGRDMSSRRSNGRFSENPENRRFFPNPENRRFFHNPENRRFSSNPANRRIFPNPRNWRNANQQNEHQNNFSANATQQGELTLNFRRGLSFDYWPSMF